MSPQAAKCRFLALCMSICTCTNLPAKPPPGSTTANHRQASHYCVLSLVDESDPYFAAVKELEKHHHATVLRIPPDDFKSLLPRLRAVAPEFVAVVIRPEMFEINLVRRFMKMATEVDDDPFLDFAYGFITGDSAETAVMLVQAGQESPPEKMPTISMVGVSEGGFLSRSKSTQQQLPLRYGHLKQTVHTVMKGKGESKRDDAFLKKVMPQLDGSQILLLAGHGYPREIVGGPTYEHLQGRDFRGAVALNIACYTGVTGTWYDQDWQTMRIRQRHVPPQESFCLNMLKTGVAGYVAYACARPAGPTMLGDALTTAVDGQSLGELRRLAGNSVVLGHLQQGFDSLQIHQESDGNAIPRNRKTQDVLLGMSTGGVLFGDPAFQPFTRTDNADPRSITVKKMVDIVEARVDIAGPLWHFFCSDQIVMWDDTTQTVRIEATILLGSHHVKDVQLADSSFGDQPYQLIAVTEQHQGQRQLHLKASFKQPPMTTLMQLSRSGVFGVFQITMSSSAAKERIIIRH